MADLRELDEDERLGPSTGAIVEAAVARGIPYRRLTRGSLVQFGWGSKQRRIQAAEVDSTSAVAESIGQDKDLTKRLLHAAGVPVPLGRRWKRWKKPGKWPRRSACPWWSSRRTATRARA
jgi:cyanophycin synthetase